MDKSFYVVNCGARKVEAKKVNIDGSDDVFYRYKVPQLLVQVIGKGKMIKTMFLNNDDFAKALHLMPEYIPAYLAYEIGAQVFLSFLFNQILFLLNFFSYLTSFFVKFLV
jgi:hypothetical protein